jgi:F0F1-type ATP synthase gamma subunit
MEFVTEGNITYKIETVDTVNQIATIKSIHEVIKNLDDVKQDKINELEIAYNASFTVFTSNATGVTKTYPINQEAKDNLERLQRRLIADPNKDSFSFYTLEDANLVDHTRSQFLQLLDDAEAFEVAQHKKYNDLKNQVNAATDEATVNSIVW